MIDLKKYIASGVLELYVLGIASEKETAEVERLKVHDEINQEIEAITQSLRHYSKARSLSEANPSVKHLALAFIDYEKRIAGGEIAKATPLLTETSHPSDFKEWLNRPDMTSPSDFEELYAKLISVTEQALTAIVWLKSGAPYEVHHHAFEKFLVLEGSCDIVLDDQIYSLQQGSYMSIPLHAGHSVKVTSPIACKVILQRVVA